MSSYNFLFGNDIFICISHLLLLLLRGLAVAIGRTLQFSLSSWEYINDQKLKEKSVR